MFSLRIYLPNNDAKICKNGDKFTNRNAEESARLKLWKNQTQKCDN